MTRLAHFIVSKYCGEQPSLSADDTSTYYEPALVYKVLLPTLFSTFPFRFNSQISTIQKFAIKKKTPLER
jgi:hypothetical protein